MTATVEPGRAEDWEDTGPIPLYTRPSGDAATWRDRGRIIADLIAERDEARATVERLNAAIDRARMERAQAEDAETAATERAEAAEAEVRDLRAKVAAVEALADRWAALGAGDVAWHWDMLAEAIRQAASVGRTEPAPEGDNSSRSLPNPNRKDQDQS